ncbi:MAPEG family protein [Sphingomonas alba]|uniref:MAPEG family protein n=1 Tax=Sphingomonas alba TaxID=2908208 RepID=A0ABT0RN70_9SPHN|nr:MAPEG family protein [Sphingomonas alba]MCL6684086.1 MAPEG family protein [Sphingomonas alba]
MKPELEALIWVSAFTALLWVPYVFNRLLVGGIAATFGYPDEPAKLSAWAQRLLLAHKNAVENLAVFTALVLTAQILDIHSPETVAAASLYLWSRVAHAAAYVLGVPGVRTVAFVGGFIAQMIFAFQLLGA